MDKLDKILTPPQKTYDIGNEAQWQDFFRILGTELPTDYRNFIQTYGTGGIDNFLWILTPFANDENVNFMARHKEILDAYMQSKTKFPQYFRHDCYPEIGGLLPWGYTDNGDELYWLTTGRPDEWKVVVYESRSHINYTYSLKMEDFLFGVITKEFVCDAFPDDFPSDQPQFISINVE